MVALRGAGVVQLQGFDVDWDQSLNEADEHSLGGASAGVPDGVSPFWPACAWTRAAVSSVHKDNLILREAFGD
eukprot:15001103-Alexandrium_andersonii.AAC.1